jgi:hypothetical protein
MTVQSRRNQRCYGRPTHSHRAYTGEARARPANPPRWSHLGVAPLASLALTSRALTEEVPDAGLHQLAAAGTPEDGAAIARDDAGTGS